MLRLTLGVNGVEVYISVASELSIFNPAWWLSVSYSYKQSLCQQLIRGRRTERRYSTCHVEYFQMCGRDMKLASRATLNTSLNLRQEDSITWSNVVVPASNISSSATGTDLLGESSAGLRRRHAMEPHSYHCTVRFIRDVISLIE